MAAKRKAVLKELRLQTVINRTIKALTNREIVPPKWHKNGAVPRG